MCNFKNRYIGKMSTHKMFLHLVFHIIVLHGITVSISSSFNLEPKTGTITDNLTWYELTLNEDPVRYTAIDFSIQFPVEACCPILLKATYNILDRRGCFSETTLNQKEFLMRTTLFYLNPDKSRERNDFRCEYNMR